MRGQPSHAVTVRPLAGRPAPQVARRAALEMADAVAGRPVGAAVARALSAALGLVGIRHTVSP